MFQTTVASVTQRQVQVGELHTAEWETGSRKRKEKKKLRTRTDVFSNARLSILSLPDVTTPITSMPSNLHKFSNFKLVLYYVQTNSNSCY